MARPTWDEYFLAIAKVVASRATCLRRKCGTVLVKENRILSSGYNGAPPGLPQCDEVGCEMVEGHCLRCTHSEPNAIAHAARYGVALDGATAYVSGGSPCYACAKVLIGAGVKEIVCDSWYPDMRAVEVLGLAGVKARVVDG